MMDIGAGTEDLGRSIGTLEEGQRGIGLGSKRNRWVVSVVCFREQPLHRNVTHNTRHSYFIEETGIKCCRLIRETK